MGDLCRHRRGGRCCGRPCVQHKSLRMGNTPPHHKRPKAMHSLLHYRQSPASHILGHAENREVAPAGEGVVASRPCHGPNRHTQTPNSVLCNGGEANCAPAGEEVHWRSRSLGGWAQVQAREWVWAWKWVRLAQGRLGVWCAGSGRCR